MIDSRASKVVENVKKELKCLGLAYPGLYEKRILKLEYFLGDENPELLPHPDALYVYYGYPELDMWGNIISNSNGFTWILSMPTYDGITLRFLPEEPLESVDDCHLRITVFANLVKYYFFANNHQSKSFLKWVKEVQMYVGSLVFVEFDEVTSETLFINKDTVTE